VRSLRPLSSRTLADRAAQLLRERILAGGLASGERLVEARIAQQLGISRGPLREALKQLAAEGLVREEPRRGTFVSTPTIETVREAYDLRAALEAKAARLVIANGDRAAVQSLRRAADRIDAASRQGDLQAMVRTDYEFHETLCLVSGNHRLLDAFVRNASVLRILLRLEGERFYHSLDEVSQQHSELLAVVEAGDAARADAAVTEHLESARDRLMRHLAARAQTDAPRAPPRAAGRPDATV
jgi:GntR family transcriptional regulator, gluconate operon transcriptional repressor